MKTFLAPNGEYITVPEGKVTTFGLSREQNKLVENSLPSKDYELFPTDVPTDLVAFHASVLIINSSVLDEDGRELLFDFYTEVGNCTDETVFWLGYPKPPEHLRTKFKCYDCFEEIAPDLKFRLLTIFNKSKNARNFSRKMADCLMILSLIRSHPGIRTQEMADELELSVRTVQRYISALQAAGEWIEYDTAKRGWRLQNGISILFGDHLEK